MRRRRAPRQSVPVLPVLSSVEDRHPAIAHWPWSPEAELLAHMLSSDSQSPSHSHAQISDSQVISRPSTRVPRPRPSKLQAKPTIRLHPSFPLPATNYLSSSSSIHRAQAPPIAPTQNATSLGGGGSIAKRVELNLACNPKVPQLSCTASRDRC